MSPYLAQAAALWLAAPLLLAQPAASFELVGSNGQRRTVVAAEFAAMPRREVTATAHGQTAQYSGVLLIDLLRMVAAPNPDSLRGPALASYVLVEAIDGYRVTFTLAEFNPSYTDRIALLVDQKDGASLSDKDGPFQIIVPDEKRPTRWIRQVKRITVVLLPSASNSPLPRGALEGAELR